MPRFFWPCGAALLAVSLEGCASIIPPFDIPRDAQNAPTVRSIVNRVTCELTRTLTESPANRAILLSNDIQVALQLNLTVNDTGGLAPSGTYINGLFSFNAGATLSQSREQNYTEKLYYSMRQLDQEIAKTKKDGFDLTKCPEVDTNLAGDLGLQAAFDLAMTSSPHLNWQAALSGTDGAFGGYVNFLVTKNLNAVGPTWMLKHFKGPGNLASLSEVNTDKITFAFAQGPAAGKPFNVISGAQNGKAELLLDQITINQLTTQLGGIRQSLQ